MSDFIIKNARIADGGGGEPFTGSVVCRNGVIADVYRENRGLSDTAGLEVVDADGLLLCPGFIDPHGHSDISILVAPDAEGKLSQGITTEIYGNCGLSAFPVTKLNRDHLNELFRRYELPLTWNSFQEYEKLVRKAHPALNVATLCGHNTLRSSVMGYDARIADAREIREMRDALAKVLARGEGGERGDGDWEKRRDGEELGESSLSSVSPSVHQSKQGGGACPTKLIERRGVLGFSTGLLYSPGNSAAREELLALGAIVAECDGVWATHLRSEGDGLLESLDEFISIGVESGCRKLHVSHLKTAGEANWCKLDGALARISQAAENEIRITADRYPYVESMTSLSVFMPSPYSDMDDSSLMKLLKTSDGFARFADTAARMPESRWSTLRIVSTSANPAPAVFADPAEVRGKILAELADEIGLAPGEICARLLRDDAAGTTAASQGMSESNMRRILAQPFVCCCTDETARPADFSLGASHPRAYGSFPKFMRTLMPQLPIGEIVRKMTSLPAEIFGLANRGAIAPGRAADLVLLDPDVIATSESATFADPHKKAAGIARVWVNGASARLAEGVM